MDRIIIILGYLMLASRPKIDERLALCNMCTDSLTIYYYRIIVEYVYEYPEDYHSHSWSFCADPLPRHYFELKSRWFPIHPLDDPHYMDRLMQTRLSYAAWPPV